MALFGSLARSLKTKAARGSNLLGDNALQSSMLPVSVERSGETEVGVSLCCCLLASLSGTSTSGCKSAKTTSEISGEEYSRTRFIVCWTKWRKIDC